MRYDAVEGIWDDLLATGKDMLGSGKNVLATASGAVAAGKAILEDPYLPEVTTLVMRLKANEAKKSGAGKGSKGPGVGLKSVVAPLRIYVAAKENPMVGVAVVAGILAIPFLAGYAFGKSR